MKDYYEIRQVDAWADAESWVWNASYHITVFETSAEDRKRAFLRALKSVGITFPRGSIYVDYDGDVYEIRERKTDRPLFAALPMSF